MTKHLLPLLLLPAAIHCSAQTRNIIGQYSSVASLDQMSITLHADSTFEYRSAADPNFYRIEPFHEKGKWSLQSDTIILNPQLERKPFVEYGLQEAQLKDYNKVLLSFNHIKRYFDAKGSITRQDTVQIDRLDFAFNALKKKNLRRVTGRATTRCAFAGYIPPETITNDKTVSVEKPAEPLTRIYIGCYELQGTKAFDIADPLSNHFTFNVYSNYYQDGQLRQKKVVVKNDNSLAVSKVVLKRQKNDVQSN